MSHPCPAGHSLYSVHCSVPVPHTTLCYILRFLTNVCRMSKPVHLLKQKEGKYCLLVVSTKRLIFSGDLRRQWEQKGKGETVVGMGVAQRCPAGRQAQSPAGRRGGGSGGHHLSVLCPSPRWLWMFLRHAFFFKTISGLQKCGLNVPILQLLGIPGEPNFIPFP